MRGQDKTNIRVVLHHLENEIRKLIMNRKIMTTLIAFSLPVLASGSDSTTPVTGSLTLADNYQSSSSAKLGTTIYCNGIFSSSFTPPSDGIMVIWAKAGIMVYTGAGRNPTIVCGNDGQAWDDVSTCTIPVRKGVNYRQGSRTYDRSCQFTPFGE